MAKQQYHHADHVRITEPGIESGLDAIVMYSYSEKYDGGRESNHPHYCLFIKDRGEVSWFYEDHITLVEKNRPDLLLRWKEEFYHLCEVRSDMDWIFIHGPEVLEKGISASIVALARELGISEDQMWGRYGEGITFYEISMRVLSFAAPFLRAGDKAGFLKAASEYRQYLASKAQS